MSSRVETPPPPISRYQATRYGAVVGLCSSPTSGEVTKETSVAEVSRLTSGTISSSLRKRVVSAV